MPSVGPIKKHVKRFAYSDMHVVLAATKEEHACGSTRTIGAAVGHEVMGTLIFQRRNVQGDAPVLAAGLARLTLGGVHPVARQLRGAGGGRERCDIRLRFGVLLQDGGYVVLLGRQRKARRDGG